MSVDPAYSHGLPRERTIRFAEVVELYAGDAASMGGVATKTEVLIHEDANTTLNIDATSRILQSFYRPDLMNEVEDALCLESLECSFVPLSPEWSRRRRRQLFPFTPAQQPRRLSGMEPHAVLLGVESARTANIVRASGLVSMDDLLYNEIATCECGIALYAAQPGILAFNNTVVNTLSASVRVSATEDAIGNVTSIIAKLERTDAWSIWLSAAMALPEGAFTFSELSVRVPNGSPPALPSVSTGDNLTDGGDDSDIGLLIGLAAGIPLGLLVLHCAYKQFCLRKRPTEEPKSPLWFHISRFHVSRRRRKALEARRSDLQRSRLEPGQATPPVFPFASADQLARSSTFFSFSPSKKRAVKAMSSPSLPAKRACSAPLSTPAKSTTPGKLMTPSPSPQMTPSARGKSLSAVSFKTPTKSDRMSRSDNMKRALDQDKERCIPGASASMPRLSGIAQASASANPDSRWSIGSSLDLMNYEDPPNEAPAAAAANRESLPGILRRESSPGILQVSASPASDSRWSRGSSSERMDDENPRNELPAAPLREESVVSALPRFPPIPPSFAHTANISSERLSNGYI